MPKRAKALTNFYSQEFGSVSVGDELQIATAETFNELNNAGYIEEIGTVQDGSIPEERATASRQRKATKKADVEFATESGVTASSMQAQAQQQQAQQQATEQAQKEMNAQSSAYATEFSQEFGSAEAQNSPNQMGKATKQAQANLNKANDNK